MMSHNSATLTFNSQTLIVKDLLPVHKEAMVIVLQDCTSVVWSKLAKALASYLNCLSSPAGCDTGDSFFEELKKGKSLLRLRVGNLRLMQNTATSRKKE